MKKLRKIIFISILSLFPLIASAQWVPSTLVMTGLPSSSIYSIVYNFLYWILAIFGLLAVIGFVISGIMYIVSAGDEDTAEKAKKYMTYCIVGVVVALSGLVIIIAINRALNTSINF